MHAHSAHVQSCILKSIHIQLTRFVPTAIFVGLRQRIGATCIHIYARTVQLHSNYNIQKYTCIQYTQCTFSIYMYVQCTCIHAYTYIVHACVHMCMYSTSMFVEVIRYGAEDSPNGRHSVSGDASVRNNTSFKRSTLIREHTYTEYTRGIVHVYTCMVQLVYSVCKRVKSSVSCN